MKETLELNTLQVNENGVITGVKRTQLNQWELNRFFLKTIQDQQKMIEGLKIELSDSKDMEEGWS